MATRQIHTLIQHLRRGALLQDVAGLTDGQLLNSFVARREEAAFETLLRRHGPMVLGVCYRILRNHHDAEDAFQATFLVFARKASSVRPAERVANWLHGVAQRTALKARTMKARNQLRERCASPVPAPETVKRDHWDDLQPLLDEELTRLPENYRLPVLLCDLEGKSIKAATQQLGWPQGTLASRLVRARKLLAKRLAQRGVHLSAGSLAMALTEKAASASMPPSLAVSTTKTAVAIAAGKAVAAGAISAKVTALMEGVLKTMLVAKLKSGTAVLLLVAMLGAGFSGRLGSEPPAQTPTSRREHSSDAAAKSRANPVQQTSPSKTAASAESGKPLRAVYSVADLVIPIPGLDIAENSTRTENRKTKEEWLIRKIVQTVAPASWEAGGGKGTIQYFPHSHSLVVNNSPRVQGQVRYLLETMRRIQEVEVATDTHLLLADAACFAKLQAFVPQLKKAGPAVLNDAEAFALLRKAQDDPATRLVHAPKVTVFPGQCVRLTINPMKDLPGSAGLDMSLTAHVAANLQHVDVNLKANVGKIQFVSTERLVEGTTLLQYKRAGENYLLFLFKPIVILSLEETIEVPPLAAEPSKLPPARKGPGR